MIMITLILIFFMDVILVSLPSRDTEIIHYKKELKSYYTLLDATDIDTLVTFTGNLMNKDENTIEEGKLINTLIKIIKKYEDTHELL